MRGFLGTYLRPVLLGLLGAFAAHGWIVACGGRVHSDANAQSSGSRIKNIVTVSEDGLRTADGNQFYDSKWEVECTLQPSEDGTTRCIPREGGAIVYSDTDCTQELVRHRRLHDLCITPPKVMRIPAPQVDDGEPCALDPYGTVELGASYQDSVFEIVGLNCISTDTEGWEFHEVKRHLPASEWVRMEKGPEE